MNYTPSCPDAAKLHGYVRDMLLRALSCCIVVLLAFSTRTPSAGLAENPILEHLQALRPTGWGDPHIIAQVEGVLSGEARYSVVLYSYKIGEERDRNAWEYLIAFQGADATPPIQVGGGPQRFSGVIIQDKVILLSGNAYAIGNPITGQA